MHKLDQLLGVPLGANSDHRHMDGRWAQLYAVAARQHGAVAVWQVTGCQIGMSTFHRHAEQHAWLRLLRGVWAVPGSTDTYERQCWAALLAFPQAVLTAESALWQASALRRAPGRTALLLPPGARVAGRDHLRFHRGRWVPGDRVEDEHGFRRAPLLRALTDFAADHSQWHIEVTIAALDRLRYTKPAMIRAYFDRRGRFPGRRKAVAALDALDTGLSHSGEERYARGLLQAADLPWPLHPRPLPIKLDGRYIAEIDFGWPLVRYGVEADGPHHHLPEVAAADRARDRKLARLRWTVDRFFVDDIRRDPRGFVQQVRSGLRAAAARGVTPWPGSTPRSMVQAARV